MKIKGKYFAPFLVLLISKIIIFFWFSSYLTSNFEGSWIPIPSDDEGYLSCVDNCIERGIWYYDHLKMEAPRVPGQSLSYALFRSFISKAHAINLLILFQIVVYSVAFTLFSKVLSLAIKKDYVFWLSIIVFSIDFQHSVWNHYVTLAESLGNSNFVLSLSFFYLFIRKENTKYLLLSGAFASFCFFFKVTNFVLLGVLGSWLIYYLFKNKTKFKFIFKYALIFSFPFILLESIWVIRNYNATSKIIPLQQIKGFPIAVSPNTLSPMGECVSFIKAFGGNWVRWNLKSEMAWFNTKDYNQKNGFTVNQNINEVFPEWIFTEKLDSKHLQFAKTTWHKSQNKGIIELERKELERKAATIFSDFKNNIIHNHPFRYYVSSRFRCFKDFFAHSGTYYFPYSFNDSSFIEKTLKLSQSILYWTIIILGFLGMIFSSFKKSTPLVLKISAILFFNFVILYCGIFRTNELRYNSTMYILLMVFSIYSITLLFTKKMIRRGV
jgi:hypothetical protein